MAASSLDASRGENERVVGVRGLVDDEVWEVFGGGGERGELGGCGRSGAHWAGRSGVDLDQVVGWKGFLGVWVLFAFWFELQTEAGFGGGGFNEFFEFGEFDFQGGQV